MTVSQAFPFLPKELQCVTTFLTWCEELALDRGVVCAVSQVQGSAASRTIRLLERLWRVQAAGGWVS